MDLKEAQEVNTKLVGEKSVIEAKLADEHKSHTATKTALAAVEGTVKALESDRDGYKARAEKAEASVIEAEVDALVAKKIAPAEKETFIELRKSNPALFTKMVAARPEMKLAAGQVVADDNTAPADVLKSGAGNGAALAAKIFGTG